VFLLTSFDVGGTERQMVELIHRLDRGRFEVHLACFHRRGALEQRATEGIASIETFPLAGFRHPSAFRQMVAFARWCRRIGARIVHTCELYSNLFGLPAAALAGVEVRIGNRRELTTADKSTAQLTAQQLAYRAARVVVANSRAAADQLRREGLPERRIAIIPNGLDPSLYNARSNRRAIRRLIMVANLRPEKGHDTLLAAVPAIARFQPDLEVVLVGDGPLRSALAEDILRRGLRDRVTLLGERQDVPSLLDASDLFVLPSTSEAFPNAVLEAMASGLPVVATRVGGIPELIESGRIGVLVDPNDPASLAQQVIDLIRSPERAFAMGAAARTHVHERYSFDRMVERFAHLYDSAIGRAHEPYVRSRELVA
jgi:glycosyltransferase involved in cell wall biosynthesis